MELKRDLQGKKQQELRDIRVQLQRLEGSSSRLQQLESELAKVVSAHPNSGAEIIDVGHTIYSVPCGLTASIHLLFSLGARAAQQHSELKC